MSETMNPVTKAQVEMADKANRVSETIKGFDTQTVIALIALLTGLGIIFNLLLAPVKKAIAMLETKIERIETGQVRLENRMDKLETGQAKILTILEKINPQSAKK